MITTNSLSQFSKENSSLSGYISIGHFHLFREPNPLVLHVIIRIFKRVKNLVLEIFVDLRILGVRANIYGSIRDK